MSTVTRNSNIAAILFLYISMILSTCSCYSQTRSYSHHQAGYDYIFRHHIDRQYWTLVQIVPRYAGVLIEAQQIYLGVGRDGPWSPTTAMEIFWFSSMNRLKLKPSSSTVLIACKSRYIFATSAVRSSASVLFESRGFPAAKACWDPTE